MRIGVGILSWREDFYIGPAKPCKALFVLSTCPSLRNTMLNISCVSMGFLNCGLSGNTFVRLLFTLGSNEYSLTSYHASKPWSRHHVAAWEGTICPFCVFSPILYAFWSKRRPISVMRPLVALLSVPLFAGISTVFGSGNTASPFLLFDVRRCPFYTPETLH